MIKKSGFTLIELMIGIAVLIVALAGILGIFTYYNRLQETSRNRSLAMNAVRAEAENIRNSDFDSIVSSTFAPLGLDGSGTAVVSAVAGSDGNLKDVRVVVCWRERDGRIIGEDNGAGSGTALDGILHPDEDADGDGEMDSPCTIVTSISRRY